MQGIDWVAWVALAVSVAAFCLSGLQTRLTQRHNRLSVQPHLTLDINLGPNGGLVGVSLFNCGIGPAVITDAVLVLDGQSLPYTAPSSWPKAWSDAGYTSRHTVFNSFMLGEALPPGERLHLVSIDREAFSANEDILLLKAARRLDLKVTYESFYHEEKKQISLAPHIAAIPIPSGPLRLSPAEESLLNTSAPASGSRRIPAAETGPQS